jgi:hypothetical protein
MPEGISMKTQGVRAGQDLRARHNARSICCDRPFTGEEYIDHEPESESEEEARSH